MIRDAIYLYLINGAIMILLSLLLRSREELKKIFTITLLGFFIKPFKFIFYLIFHPYFIIKDWIEFLETEYVPKKLPKINYDLDLDNPPRQKKDTKCSG